MVTSSVRVSHMVMWMKQQPTAYRASNQETGSFYLACLVMAAWQSEKRAKRG